MNRCTVTDYTRYMVLPLVTIYDVFIRMYTYTKCNACTSIFVS